jgi:hypothetical protein
LRKKFGLYTEEPPDKADHKLTFIMGNEATGDSAGPDLAGMTQQREQGWLAEPDKMLAEGEPIALPLCAQYKQVPMPNLLLSGSDVAALLAYLAMHPARPLGPAQVAR